MAAMAVGVVTAALAVQAAQAALKIQAQVALGLMARLVQMAQLAVLAA